MNYLAARQLLQGVKLSQMYKLPFKSSPMLSNRLRRQNPSPPSRPFSATSNPQAPSRADITTLFQHMEAGDYAKFFKSVSPDVDWTVMGTHPCAGHYTSLREFQEKTLARLGKIMKPPGIRLKVRNVIGGGKGADWATVELIANAECLNGFKFDNTYAWCVRFDESGTIVQVRAYLDSWMVKEALEENEDGEVESQRAPVPGAS